MPEFAKEKEKYIRKRRLSKVIAFIVVFAFLVSDIGVRLYLHFSM